MSWRTRTLGQKSEAQANHPKQRGSHSDLLHQQCTWAKIRGKNWSITIQHPYLTAKLLKSKSAGVSERFALSLKGSRTLPVLDRHSWVYKALIFCSSASTAAVLLARERKVPCWTWSVAEMPGKGGKRGKTGRQRLDLGVKRWTSRPCGVCAEVADEDSFLSICYPCNVKKRDIFTK